MVNERILTILSKPLHKGHAEVKLCLSRPVLHTDVSKSGTSVSTAFSKSERLFQQQFLKQKQLLPDVKHLV